ncbi:MAG TPA: site-2 protease family protein [Sedimentisphaerales bacterium]|nr:site-2 protease family protein [Sedimentisphaerales bacterium]
MRWSINIGKIFGINFRIHITFFLLLIFIFASVLDQRGLGNAIYATLFICSIFACVLIHEIGHSLIARRFGKQAKSITLLPIGGMAIMEEMPEKPSQEIAMSIVGPFINLVIAGVLYLFVGKWTGIGVPNLYPDSARTFFAGLIGANIMLAVFNLIPAFPMDGGRVLRGILATQMDYVRATSAAVHIGQALAMFFIFFGIFYNLWLALIGLFLYIGAGSEKQHVVLRSFLHQVPASEAMTTEYRSVRPDEPLSRVFEHFHHGCQDDFPVIGESGIEGILTRDRILASIHEKGLDVPVSDVMDRDFTLVAPTMPLDDVYKKLLASQKTAVIVADKGEVKGMICLDSISRYLMIKAALKRIDAENILPRP